MAQTGKAGRHVKSRIGQMINSNRPPLTCGFSIEMMHTGLQGEAFLKAESRGKKRPKAIRLAEVSILKR